MLLNLNWQIIWVFVNLLILFLLMKKFLFGPVTRLLDERAQGVADTISQADEQLSEAAKTKAAYEGRLADAHAEAARIVENAQKSGEAEYHRRLTEAEQAVKRLNEQAARQREADHAAMLAEAKKQVAALVLLTAAKVSQRTLDADADSAMLNSFLAEVGEEL